MGARQSTEARSVSMDNPNPTGVIDVSEDVVQRLKLGIKQQVKENVTAEYAASAKSKAKQQQETRDVPSKSATSGKPAAPAAAAPIPRSPPIVFQNPTPAYVQTPIGATVTALEVRRQKEIELQQNDAMWQQRLTQLEQMLNKTNSIMEQEYSSAVEDVRKRFSNASPVHQLPPCQDLKAKVISCYQNHRGETLNCAEEVACFRNCVSEHRVKKLDEVQEQSKFVLQPLNATATAKSAKAA